MSNQEIGGGDGACGVHIGGSFNYFDWWVDELSDDNLYIDYTLPFSLPVRDILEAPVGPVQNILGTSECPDGDNDPTTDDCSIESWPRLFETNRLTL